MNIHLVMFYTPIKFGQPDYYKDSVNRMIESAKKWGVENFHLYTPDNLPVADYLLEWMHKTLDPGFGFYSWKPLVILDVMKNIPEGDVILYHDAGRKEYNFEFRKDINILVQNVINNYNGIGIAQGPFLHKQWCKKDCFIEMGCDEEKYIELNQLSATWGIWQKNSLALKILNEWKQYCFDPSGIVTTNDNTGKLSDFNDFQEHRWDQAIITNLLFKYNFNNFNVKPLVPTPGKWEKDINNFIDDGEVHVPVKDPFTNNCLFNTHATLTKEHAEYCLQSLLINQTERTTWHNFIIYNSQPHIISDEWLLEAVKRYDRYNCIKNTILYPFDNSKPKTLTQDLINQLEFLDQPQFTEHGKTLLLKSDYCLSNNFNRVFNLHYNLNNIWSLPIYNAKSKVNINEIFERCKLNMFTPVDDITYYRGGDNQWLPKNEFGPDNLYDLSPEIRFVSHATRFDYNVPVFTNDILSKLNSISRSILPVESTWGDANGLFGLAYEHGVNMAEELQAFGVHMYHSIISENRAEDRNDGRKTHIGEEY